VGVTDYTRTYVRSNGTPYAEVTVDRDGNAIIREELLHLAMLSAGFLEA
jgi:hypothetical protein